MFDRWLGDRLPNRGAGGLYQRYVLRQGVESSYIGHPSAIFRGTKACLAGSRVYP
jgi:hypothetical protein